MAGPADWGQRMDGAPRTDGAPLVLHEGNFPGCYYCPFRSNHKQYGRRVSPSDGRRAAAAGGYKSAHRSELERQLISWRLQQLVGTQHAAALRLAAARQHAAWRFAAARRLAAARQLAQQLSGWSQLAASWHTAQRRANPWPPARQPSARQQRGSSFCSSLHGSAVCSSAARSDAVARSLAATSATLPRSSCGTLLTCYARVL